MRAVVLCAGLGTRLRPLTNSWPKPAIPVLGQPLLRYSLAMLRSIGVQWAGINTHHLPKVMQAVASFECRRAGIQVELSHEPIIQGTGGGIRGFRHWLSDAPFLVLNGDVLFSLPLAALLQAHRDSGALATIGRQAAVAAIGRMRLTGALAWLLWSAAHVYFLIGFRNRVAVTLDWAWAYVTFDRGARLITGARPMQKATP